MLCVYSVPPSAPWVSRTHKSPRPCVFRSLGVEYPIHTQDPYTWLCLCGCFISQVPSNEHLGYFQMSSHTNNTVVFLPVGFNLQIYLHEREGGIKGHVYFPSGYCHTAFLGVGTGLHPVLVSQGSSAKYHKLRGFKQQQFIVLQFRSLEV